MYEFCEVDEDAIPDLDHATDFSDPIYRGIVLAGGGAKGAYQAGTLKAAYRFLAQNNALPTVRVLANTSIGSWNAGFWLAHLIKPAANWDGRSIHEQWWRPISAKSLAAPSWYVPLLRWQLVRHHFRFANLGRGSQ
jgi:predicted acylesterase/phospholipase RssA